MKTSNFTVSSSEHEMIGRFRKIKDKNKNVIVLAEMKVQMAIEKTKQPKNLADTQQWNKHSGSIHPTPCGQTNPLIENKACNKIESASKKWSPQENE